MRECNCLNSEARNSEVGNGEWGMGNGEWGELGNLDPQAPVAPFAPEASHASPTLKEGKAFRDVRFGFAHDLLPKCLCPYSVKI